IDSNGRVTARTEKNTPAVLTGTVETNGGRTLYSRVGNVLVPVCAGLAFLLMLGRLLFRIRRR
ncbi:MAG: hypothetical protein ILO68_04100, partial [Clostridia bacterium]|nr:hypothetical protein [Clostridia bacterium]